MFSVLNRRTIGGLLLACVCTFAAACDDEPTLPTPTPPNPVTDTFAGQLTPNGAVTHSFNAASAGNVTATLKTIGADNTLVVGFSLGNWNSTSSTCSAVKANDTATGGSVLDGTMTNSGPLCVRIYDVGNLTAAATAYSIEVVHP
jgi:hypothetical protein